MESAPFVFHKADMFVVCCVNDLLVFSKHGRDTMKFKTHLHKAFLNKNLGHPTHFLGMEMKWIDSLPVTLRQSMLIEKMLATHGMKNSTEGKRPMNPSENERNNMQSLDNEDASVYRSNVSVCYVAH